MASYEASLNPTATSYHVNLPFFKHCDYFALKTTNIEDVCLSDMFIINEFISFIKVGKVVIFDVKPESSAFLSEVFPVVEIKVKKNKVSLLIKI